MERESITFEPEWLEDSRLTWPARILLAKLSRLTNSGEKPFVSKNCNSFFMDMMGFARNELKNAWIKLVEAGYINKSTDKLAGNVTTVTLVVGGLKSAKGVVEKQSRGSLKPAMGVAENQLSSNHSINNHSNTLYIQHTEKNEISQKTLLKRTAYRKQSSNYNYNKSNFCVENQPQAQVGRFHSSFLMNEEAKNLFVPVNT